MSGTASVIIPTHYGNETLPVAIESALGQRFGDIEVVVVDDSGERHAEGIAAEYDVEYVAHEENWGQVAGWETGMDETTGEYVQFLDDDDRLHERKIAEQVELLERTAGSTVAYCGLQLEDGTFESPRPSVRGDILHEYLGLDNHPITTSTLLIERSSLEAIRPFPRYSAGTDIPLVIELARQTEFDYVDEVLVSRITHSRSHQGQSKASAEARWHILEEYADLYSQFPEEVYQQAVANTARHQGLVYLQHHRWSWRATTSFWREVRATPANKVKPVLRLLVSLLGAPGMNASRSLLDRLPTP